MKGLDQGCVFGSKRTHVLVVKVIDIWPLRGHDRSVCHSQHGFQRGVQLDQQALGVADSHSESALPHKGGP